MEQAVTKKNNGWERRFRLILRSIQFTLLTLLVLGETLGFTLSGVLWETDKDLFWQWVFLAVVLALPAVAVCLILEFTLRRHSVEYDYELHTSEFIIYRLVYGRRKRWVSFEFSNVLALRSYPEAAADSSAAGELRRSVIACLNTDDDDALLCVSLSSFLKKNRVLSGMVILEPNAAMRAALVRACGGRARP